MSPRQSRRLSEKQAAFEDSAHRSIEESPKPTPSKRPRMSNAERMRQYRQRRKEDPEKYQQYLNQNRESCRSYRQARTPEEMKLQQMKATERQREYRKLKAEQPAPEQPTLTRKLIAEKRAKLETQREKWRAQYQLKARNMHHKTREAINAKRREKYTARKKPNSTSVPSTQRYPAPVKVDPRTPAAQRKALQRARESLPKSPTSFLSTVLRLISSASPRKRELFQEKFNVMTMEMGTLFIDACKRLKDKRLKKHKVERSVLFGLCRGYTYRSLAAKVAASRKTIKRHMEEKPGVTSTSTQQCRIERTDIARKFIEESGKPLPDKKLVSKKTGKGAIQLQKPLSEIYRDFQNKTGSKQSFSGFAKCRPKHVRLMAQASLDQCLCEYCSNVKLKLVSLNSLGTLYGVPRIQHERHAVSIITCGTTLIKSCCYGDCKQCGIHLLQEHIEGVLLNPDDMTWYRWEFNLTNNKGHQIKRKMLVTKTGTAMDFIKELLGEVKFLAGHLFRADWQHNQFTAMKNAIPFPAQEVIMVLDFAENFACIYQDEVQSAHWHHSQATLHPIVCYYRCLDCQQTVTESLVFVSSDKTHDHHAVWQFTKMAVRHLRTERGLPVTLMRQWTDGCASQYKSKGPFADIANGSSELGLGIERNYFGSRHGKGPSDGESAVVKNMASKAIASRTAIIATAEDLYAFCIQSSLNKQPREDKCMGASDLD